MTIVEQLEKLQADHAGLKANTEASSAAITAKDQEISELKAKAEELINGKSMMESAYTEKINGIQAKFDAEISAHAESKKTIDDISKKLSDPAFKIAGISGDDSAVSDGGAVSCGSESKTLGQQMKEIADPKERRAFYLANEKEIKAGM